MCRPNEGHAEVDATDRMISLQFSWGADTKNVSSIFIGTSPEFELALYTLCFVAGAEVPPILKMALLMDPPKHAYHSRNTPCLDNTDLEASAEIRVAVCSKSSCFSS